MRDLLLTVHVLAAVIWVGGAVVMHVLGRRALARGDGEETYRVSREINKVAGRLFAPLSVILLVAGILLVNEAGYEFSQAWISIALAAWLISFVIGVGFYPRQDKKLEALGPGAPGAGDNVRTTLAVNSVEVLILVLVVIDMTVKPGAPG